MLRRHPDGWGAFRQALFALVPVLLGTAVVVTGGDEPTAGVNRIEATRTRLAPAPEPQPATPSAIGAPAAPAFEPATTSALADASSPTTETALPGSTSTIPQAATPMAGESSSPAPEATTADAEPSSSTTTAPAPAPDATVPTTAPAAARTTTTTTAPAPARTGRSPNPSAAAEVVPLTNADRSEAGLGSLSRSSCLDSVASDLAEQMAGRGVLAHNPGAGAGVLGCRPGAAWGDNVGRALPCDTARLEREWMASPGHRRNILTGTFAFIGVGVWTGEDGTCWVQVLFSS